LGVRCRLEARLCLLLGHEVATKLFELRKANSSDAKVEYAYSAGADQLPPPMNAHPVLPQWSYGKPYMLESAMQFELSEPPAPGSAAFAKDLTEVKSLGAKNGSVHTNEQTTIAIWAGGEEGATG
jgi:hypothetical protein